MTLNTLPRAAILAAIVVAGASSAAVAQMADPHHADATTSQATPSPDSDDMASQGQNGQPAQPGVMGRNMMQSGMPMMGMRGHMMKVMFAVADVDGDGALSFEEVTTIHKRIFDKVDANKDGKVTPDEVHAFMRP
jgi:EF hand